MEKTLVMRFTSKSRVAKEKEAAKENADNGVVIMQHTGGSIDCSSTPSCGY